MSENYEEDWALTVLDQDNMNKLITSLQSYLENPDVKAYNILISENLIEFLDAGRKIAYGYYSGFQGLLTKTLKLLEQAKNKCNDDDLMVLINDSINLINQLLKNYGYEIPKYEYPEYKYPKYEKSQEQRLAEEYAHQIQNRNFRPLGDIGAIIAKDIREVHDNIKKISSEEAESPEITEYLNKVLKRLEEDKERYSKAKVELNKRKSERYEFLSKEEELSNWRKVMLGKVIDQLISEGRDQ